jgi:hypothetical protein
MSSHKLRGNSSVPFVKLWSNPSKFVLDEMEYVVYMNGFRSEGGFHLGSCEHIYYPMCLISLMVVHRHCALCKAPSHECLYDLFGLYLYMPVSWECDLNNTPGPRYLWGDDLVWTWQQHDHFHNKSNISSQFGWKKDHEEIVRVCQKLVGVGTQIKEREISSTNASMAIGMRSTRGSNSDNIQMDGCGMKIGSASITV